MKNKSNKNIPAVTWVSLQPESSARTSLKSVDEYLSEIQDDMPRPPRRLCLSPETLKALENAEKLVENAERQLSKMNFNSIIAEELESETFNGKANEEEKIYIRNVVASTLKKGFYDPSSSAALAEHLKPSKISTCESRRPLSPLRTHRLLRTATEPSIDPRRSQLGCLVCKSAKECRAAEEAAKPIPQSTGAAGGEELPPERLSVHRAPDVNIKAELAVRTVKIVDIQPQESLSSVESRENVATFEVRHESVRLGPEPTAKVQATKPRAHRVQKQKLDGEKIKHLAPSIEKRRKHRRRREEKVVIDDIPIGELSLTEPRILADIDSLLGRQREVIRQLNRFDEFLASKLPGEPSSANELEPPIKIKPRINAPISACINAPVARTKENIDSGRASSKFRKPEVPEKKSDRAVESTESTEDSSSTASSEEVEIAFIDYTESFESASSVAGTKSDAGFVEDLQEANLDAGACEESEESEGAPSVVSSQVNIQVNVQVEIDEESIEEDKDGSATEKLQGSSQKTSHLIDSMPDSFPSELSNNSLRLSTVSGNVESTESKIESKISEVRGNLDSLLRSIDASERVDDAGAQTMDKLLKSTDLSAENRYDLDPNCRSRSKSQVEQANEVVEKNGEAEDLMNELRISEKSAGQSSRSNRVDKDRPSRNINSQTNAIKQLAPLDGGTSKISMRDSNSNRSERDEDKLISQSSALDDISELLEGSLEIDVDDKKVTDKIRQENRRQEKILDNKRNQISSTSTVAINNQSSEAVDRGGSIEDVIVGKAQKKLSAVKEIPKTFKALIKNNCVEMKVNDQNGQGEDVHFRKVSESFETSNECNLIERSDHRQDKVPKKPSITLGEINITGGGYNMSNTRSLMTLLEENSEEVRDSFQQQKLTLLKILESCSIPSSHRGKRVFTSTVLGDLEPPCSFARLKESSQSESSSDTYSEGEVRFSSSTSHSVGEIRRKNEFSKSSSLMKTASSGTCNPTTSLSYSAGEVSEIAVDSLR